MRRYPSTRACAPVVVALSVALALASATALAAQTDARLIAAVRQAQEGHSDSARAAVQGMLATVPATDTLYPQVLYIAGMVATEATDMRRQFQRVVIEYPASSWADDALLRLAQLNYATHQLDDASRDLERIALDFPASPLFPQAAYWAGRTYFDLKDDTRACRWLADGMARARDDVEVQTQLGYLYQRCGAAPDSGSNAARRPDSTTAPTPPVADPTPATPPDTAKPRPAASATPTPKPAPAPASTPTPAPAPAPADHAKFRVQVAAAGTSAAAEAIAGKARSLGYTAVVVSEKGLYKVRIGGFATREAAQQAIPTLKAKLGGNPFVVAN